MPCKPCVYLQFEDRSKPFMWEERVGNALGSSCGDCAAWRDWDSSLGVCKIH